MSPSYRSSIGPRNISEGHDPYGPGTRAPQAMATKLAHFTKGRVDAVMFHDNDILLDHLLG